MTTTQDTFSQYSAIGYHGQINTTFPSWIDTMHAEGGAIGFGLAVVAGTDDKQAALADGTSISADIIGITVRTQAVENDVNGVSKYAENAPMSVMKKGRQFLVVADGSARGEQVYVDTATGSLVSTSTEYTIALTGAKFVRTAAAGAITEIELA